MGDYTYHHEASAVFSPCRTWRYSLTRRWDPDRPLLVVIGLNPSTADETKDDPTIRRCIRYASEWHRGGLLMVNLFAFRATNPMDMMRATDPVGPENNATLAGVPSDLPILCAWGAHGVYRERCAEVSDLLTGRPLVALGVTKSGQPKHPLYMRADIEPQPWLLCKAAGEEWQP